MLHADDQVNIPDQLGAINGLDDAEDVPQLTKGTTLGAYTITKSLGRGGMGEVFLASRDDGLFDQEVAIKVAHATLSPKDLKRVTQERQILATLDHPGIATILDGGTTPGWSALPGDALSYRARGCTPTVSRMRYDVKNA